MLIRKCIYLSLLLCLSLSSTAQIKGFVYLSQAKKDSIRNYGAVLAERKVAEAIQNKATVLSFDSVAIWDIPKNICELKNLKELNLKGGAVGERIDSSYIKNKSKSSTCSLYTFYESIPSLILCLKNLEVLHLGGNAIKVIPNEIGRLENLRKLYLNNTYIDEPCLLDGLEVLKKSRIFRFVRNKVKPFARKHI